MSNFTDFMEQTLLGATLLGSSYTSPATVYAGLLTALSTVGSEVSFTEVLSGLGYIRLPIEFSDITSAPDSTCVNSATITWSPATTPWGGVVAFGVFDAEAIGGGDFMYWGEPTSTRTVLTDDDRSALRRSG